MSPLPGPRPIVAVVHLGRARARGEGARVATWSRLVEAAGGTAVLVPLLAGQRPSIHLLSAVAPLVRNQIVPEAAAWSPSAAARQLRSIGPDAVVCVTSRAWHPALAEGRWVTVLDQVDSLGVSYGERARIARSPLRRSTYSVLARTAVRFERDAHRLGVATVMAGWSDAKDSGAVWLPNVVELPIAPHPAPAEPTSVDVCFVGTLSYPPNVEALQLLAAAWPIVISARPGATALVAGANVIGPVVDLVRAQGWQLAADFPDPADIYGRARIAVAPLLTTSGIQNKVLEAAAHAVPQIVTPAALAGLAPGFPADVASEAQTFGEAIVRLLGDPQRQRQLASAARAHVAQTYVASAWLATTLDLLGHQVAS